MEKVSIKRSCFDKIFNNKKLLDEYEMEINNKKSKSESMRDAERNLKETYECIGDIYSNILKESFIEDMLNYLNNTGSILMNNLNIRYCEKCNKQIIPNDNTHVISSNFANIENNFCNCEIPNYKFNISIFNTNINFLIFNWIMKIQVWMISIKEILYYLNTGLKNNELDIKALINYKIDTLIEDIYTTSDSVKTNIYIMDKNIYVDESMIPTDFYTKNLKEIKDIQKYRDKLISKIKNIKINSGMNSNLNVFDDIDTLSFKKDWKTAKHIIDWRNRIVHNHITICHGNYIEIGNPDITYKFVFLWILLLDNILFMYSILESFECFE